MSKNERLASFLDRITDLCFSISELGINEGSEGEVAKPSTSSGLSPEAPAFIPASKGKEQVSGDQGSKSAISEDWEGVSVLPSESVELAPSYSQVAGSSYQAIYDTPVRRRVREQSVDSAESGITMAAPGGGVVPPGPPVQPNFATCTAAQFEVYWNALPNDGARIAAETLALAAGNAPLMLAVLAHWDERNMLALLVSITSWVRPRTRLLLLMPMWLPEHLLPRSSRTRRVVLTFVSGYL